MAVNEQARQELARRELARRELARRESLQSRQPTQRPDRFQLKSEQPYDTYGYGDALTDTAKTTVNSLADLGENLSFPVRHPIQTVKGVASAAVHPIRTAKAIGGHFTERYGTQERLAETVSKDPFGFASDVVGTAYGARALASGAKATVPAVKGAVKKTGQVVTAPVRYAKDLIQTPGKARKLAKEAIFDIEQNTREKAYALTKKSKMQEGILSRKYQAMEQGYGELDRTLDYLAKKQGTREAIALQKELPKHFSNMSTKYGQRLEKLIGKDPIEVPTQTVFQSLEESLLNKGVLRFEEAGNIVISKAPRTKAERLIYSGYKRMKGEMEIAPEAVIDVRDLIRSNNVIKPKYGKKWTPDDHMQADLVEKLSQHINDAVPGIKDLKTEFRPYLQWKDRAIKRLKPFAGERETSQASNIISKLGTKEISFDDKRMLGELERQIGREVGGKVKQFRGGQAKTAIKRDEIRRQAESAMNELKSSTSDEVFRLKQNKNLSVKGINEAADKIIAEYSKKRTIAGAGTAVVALPLLQKTFLRYFLRREIFNLLRGDY